MVAADSEVAREAEEREEVKEDKSGVVSKEGSLGKMVVGVV